MNEGSMHGAPLAGFHAPEFKTCRPGHPAHKKAAAANERYGGLKEIQSV
ncbi:MAG: hypothetical protein ABI845_07150 [Polaromonas sp.]